MFCLKFEIFPCVLNTLKRLLANNISVFYLISLFGLYCVNIKGERKLKMELSLPFFKMKHNMHINQISQYFRVYVPFNLIMITKSSTMFTHWTSAILKAWILSITSLRSLADVYKYNHTEKRCSLWQKHNGVRLATRALNFQEEGSRQRRKKQVDES